MEGIEPSTSVLSGQRSTIELHALRYLPHAPHFLQLGGFRKVKGNNFPAFYQTLPESGVTDVDKKSRGGYEIRNKEPNHY